MVLARIPDQWSQLNRLADGPRRLLSREAKQASYPHLSHLTIKEGRSPTPMSAPETTATHQPSTATDDQSSGNEAAPIGAELFRAQYDSLRAEILAAKTSRSAWVIQVASLAGVFLTLGVTNWFGAGMAVLVYPLLSCFYAAEWRHDNGRIAQVCYFIATCVESWMKRLGVEYIGWEYFKGVVLPLLLRLAKSTSDQRERTLAPLPAELRREIEKHDLAKMSSLEMPPKLVEFSSRGIFLSTQLLAVALGVIRVVEQGLANPALAPLLGLLSTASVLLIIDGWAVYRTIGLLQHHRYHTDRESAGS
jgi:hypothetical protein